MQKFDWRLDSYPMYINLEHREDRKQHIKEQLEKFGIKADRVRGVYFHEVEDSDNPKYKKMVDSSKNQLGCYIAHINCLERAYKIGSSAIIFEDDANISEEFIQKMDYIQYFLNNNEWDIIWFGASCTEGYLVNYNSIPKILHLLEEVLYRSTSIDHSFIMIEPFTKTFAMEQVDLTIK
jgi:GR25 family glycosyltransferase involved in LPS biosynthesis